MTRHRSRTVPPAPRLLALSAVLLLGLTACAPEESNSPQVSPVTTAQPSTPTPAPEPSSPPPFDRAAHTLDAPDSLWVVTNKLRPLAPLEWAPSDLQMPEGVENEFAQPLRAPAARAVSELVSTAQAAGVPMRIISAYRDYGTQVGLYTSYVARDGATAADTYSARPGHSEHQTGLSVDFDDGSGCYLEACFAGTPAGSWLAEHAWEHGFILRYPEGKSDITGFTYEPWHFRFVGQELAAEMHRTGTATLEEFFGLDPAPAYL